MRQFFLKKNSVEGGLGFVNRSRDGGRTVQLVCALQSCLKSYSRNVVGKRAIEINVWSAGMPDEKLQVTAKAIPFES